MSATRRAWSVAVYCVRGRGEDARVLLVHHRKLDLWLPVGGEVEPGETPQEAARRECIEETGFDAFVFPRIMGSHSGTPDGLLTYEEHEAGAKGLHLNLNFVVLLNQHDEHDRREPRSDGSWAEYRWVRPRAHETEDAAGAVVYESDRAPVPRNVGEIINWIPAVLSTIKGGA